MASSSVTDLTRLCSSELFSAISRSSILAKEAQTLVSFKSATHWVPQRSVDVSFAVRVAESLARKPTASSANKDQDPFMPPFEEGLCVGKLDQHHHLMLNKFNVVENHVLITTQMMEFQHSGIKKEAFPAIIRVLNALNGLVFFNRGKDSGASQAHKHYQVIPKQEIGDLKDFPIAGLIERVAKEKGKLNGEAFEVESMPFKHACCYSVEKFTPESMEKAYHNLMNLLSIHDDPLVENVELSYNWLSTENWMFLVLRSKETYHEPTESKEEDKDFLNYVGKVRIPVNSLGFAGTFFVKTTSALEHIKSRQPFDILAQVSVPK
jgi:ATP adenylyltransferase